jgi:hypothetical protein
MIIVQNDRGLYLRTIKRGALVWTPRALDAMEFASADDARQFIESTGRVPSNLTFLS